MAPALPQQPAPSPPLNYPDQSPSPAEDTNIPTASILLLGDVGTGKHTFLSRLSKPPPSSTTTSSSHSLHPPGSTPISQPLPLPSSWPLSFSITLYSRPYLFKIYSSTSRLFTDPFPENPSMVIITYAIPRRETLWNAKNYWFRQFQTRYVNFEDAKVPVMLLGLQRDLRTDRKIPRSGLGDGVSVHGSPEDGDSCSDQSSWQGRGAREARSPAEDATGPEGSRNCDDYSQYECVMPDEGLRTAQEMRVDAYAECSALTGELMWEVMEDVTKIAARTTTARGWEGRESCVVL